MLSNVRQLFLIMFVLGKYYSHQRCHLCDHEGIAKLSRWCLRKTIKGPTSANVSNFSESGSVEDKMHRKPSSYGTPQMGQVTLRMIRTSDWNHCPTEKSERPISFL